MTHGHGNIGNIDRPDLVGKDYSVVSEEIGKAERLQLFRIIVRGAWDCFSNLAKTPLKKIMFQRELPDGFKHLVILSLQASLLSLSRFLLRI